MRQSYDIEASDLFLSCMLHDPAGIALYAQRVDGDDFPLQQRLVWNSMVECVLVDQAVPTYHELLHRLTNTSQGVDTAMDVVTLPYLAGLKNVMIEAGIHSPAKAELFCQRIEQSSFRNLVHTLKMSCEEALSMKVLDFEKWWAEAYAHVVGRLRKRQMGPQKLGDFYKDLKPAIDAWLKGEPYMVVPTGFRSFDSVLGGGFLERELHILGGPPGTTKTTLALTMSLRQAELGYTVGWSSLEMPGDMLFLRAMCMDAGLDWSKLRSGAYKNDSEAVAKKLAESRARLRDLPIFVDDATGVTTERIHLQALQMSMTYGIHIWYVDFAQLLTDLAPGPIEQAAKIFQSSKEIAKLLGIPIVVLSQVTKRVEYSQNKLPMAHDIPFRGHDVAGVVILTWDVYKFKSLGQIDSTMIPGVKTATGEQVSCDRPDRIYYVLAKFRYGKEGVLALTYNREFGKITDPFSSRETSF